MKLYWLASYPKSGNTWMRVFLNNYWENGDQPYDINALGRTPALYARELFDDVLNVESALLTYDEIDRLRPAFCRAYAETLTDWNGQFCKVHDAFERLSDGTPIFPPDVTAAVIYIIRSPLDVAVSYAHHSAVTVDEAIAMMGDETHALSMFPNTQSHQLHQRLRTWSGHVLSWVDQTDVLPVIVVRYEDMLMQPLETFGRVIRAVNWEVDSARLEKAIRFSSFEELKSQERSRGFYEKPRSAASFFRKGEAENWRSVLTPLQVERICADHGAVMARFGYLPRA
jgi:hypothetical protein